MVDFDGRLAGSTYDRPMESYWLCIVCLNWAVHAPMARMTCCITSMRRKRGWRWHRSVAKKKGNSTHRDTQDTQSTDVLGNYLIFIIIIIIIIIIICYIFSFLGHFYGMRMSRFANSKIQDCYFFKHLITLGEYSRFWYGWNPMLSMGDD